MIEYRYGSSINGYQSDLPYNIILTAAPLDRPSWAFWRHSGNRKRRPKWWWLQYDPAKYKFHSLAPGRFDWNFRYRQVSIRCTLVGNKIVDHSDVVGASPVGAAPTTSSFSTSQLASIYMYCPLAFGASYIRDFTVSIFQVDFSDWWLWWLFWNCTQMNITGPHWW